MPERTQRASNGFTLVEILVAVTIFAIATGIAFVLYNAIQSSYRQGEQLSRQQQETRVAFDRLMAEIRMAGFNHNPDGDASRPDEQIEGAWDTAIAFRGDLDFEVTPAQDPLRNNVTPETSLRGPYNVVSTGNDEIVAYALGKEDASGGVDLIFHADVGESPRDKDVEEVRVPGIHLVQDAPPYVLYRLTLANDTGTFGDWEDFAVREEVARNLRSLTFRYFDANGNQVNGFDLTQTADDIGGGEASPARAARDSIRRIEIDLVGMTPDPDGWYLDPDDAVAATQHFRKFRLGSDVVPANLGQNGMADLVLTDPRPPEDVTLCAGHCGGMVVEWENPNASEDAVSGYTVWYGASPSDLDTPVETGSLWAWVGNLGGGPHYFAVQARNASGGSSLFTPPIAGTTGNDTTPLPPATAGLWASGGSDPAHPALNNRIDLGWSAVIENTSEGASEAVNGCDPDRPVTRDLAGYRVYRGESSGFAAGPPAATEADVPGTTTWTDESIVNCRDYYYRVTAVDSCGTEGDPSAETSGVAVTSTPPAAPSGLTATQSSPWTVDLRWEPVTRNAASPPQPTAVAGYKIYSAQAAQGSDPELIPEGSYFLIAGPVAETNYTHYFSGVLPGNSLYYKASAVDDCPNESALSGGAESSCEFHGTIDFSPADGSNLVGLVKLLLSVVGGDTYVRAQVGIRGLSLGNEVYLRDSFTITNSGPGTNNFLDFPDWDTTAAGPGIYRITFQVENSMGCINQGSVIVTVNEAIACCVGAASPELLPTTGAASDKNSNLAFNIANNCGKDIEIIGTDTSWTETVGDTSTLKEIEYPTGTVVFAFTPPSFTPALANLLSSPLFLSQFNDSMSPVNMTLDWNGPLATKVGPLVVSETIVNTFHYRTLAGSGQGACTMIIKPDSNTVEVLDGLIP